MNKKLLAMALPAALLLSTTTVNAEDGFFVGANLGQAKADQLCDGLVGVGSLTCDDSDTSLKISGGYMFSDYIGLELAYSDLGEAKISDGFSSLKLNFDALAISAIGSLPVSDNFSLFAKAGYADMSVKASFEGESESDSETDFVYGLGTKYSINDNAGIVLELERFDFDGLDIDTTSIGFQYRF